MISQLWQSFILLALLGVVTITDGAANRIPNIVTIPGMIAGLTLSYSGVKGLVIKLIFLVALFFIGMLNMGQMGDIKLWMMTACFVGPAWSSVVFLLAAVLFLVASALSHRKEFVEGARNLKTNLLLRTRVQTTKKRPFAPYVFVSYAMVFLMQEALHAVVG